MSEIDLPHIDKERKVTGIYSVLEQRLKGLSERTPAGTILEIDQHNRDDDLLIQVLKGALPYIPVELGAVFHNGKVTITSGEEHTIYSITDIKRVAKTDPKIKVLHTHTKAVPPSQADLFVATQLPTSITWLLLTEEDSYKFRAKGDLDPTISKSDKRAIHYALTHGIIEPDSLNARIAQYSDSFTKQFAGISGHLPHLKSAIETLHSGAIDNLTKEQKQAILEMGAGQIGNKFYKQFEKMGYRILGGIKFKDMPFLEMLEKGISSNLISIDEVTNLLSSEAETTDNQLLRTNEIIEKVTALKKLIAQKGADSDEAIAELMKYKSGFLLNFYHLLEDAGIPNKTLFEQTKVEDEDDFKTQAIAIKKIDKNALLKSLED